MSGGMKWLLLSMLISLSRGRFCRNSGNCSCQEVSYWEWEIRCPSDSKPKFIARFNMYTTNGQVECRNATSWSEFGYQWTSPLLYGWSTLAIERCPLPDESFDHLAERFGFTAPSHLTFNSHMNLSSTLTRRHLSMLPDLDNLNLSSNGLTELPSDLFRDLGWLGDLDLSFNMIAILPYDIFHGSSKLWFIDLSFNAMKFVDWRLFDNCTDMRTLSLRGNFLTSLDHRTFRNVHRLYRIDLAENLLETPPQNVFDYVEELMLDISGNRFSTLPEELFSRTNLQRLRFHHNRGNLTTLPMNFLNNLTHLVEVNLLRNNLTSLPENIFWGSFSVQGISLHGNALSTLPENIFRDSGQLISLDLSDNRLNYVPETLFHALTKMWFLNLTRNGISSLSENIFRNLDSLHELDLGFNKITEIHPATFYKLASIRIIRLSHNSVRLTESGTLSLGNLFNGPTIQKIFLNHNNLTGPFFIGDDDEIMSDHQLVDLTYNQITEVTVLGPLIGSHDVKYDLRYNNIRSIELHTKIFSKMTILVDHNPLYCGCMMSNSLEYMHEVRELQSAQDLQIIFGNASCSEPYWMKGTPVASLKLETFACRPDDDNRHVRCAVGCDCWWRPYDKTRIVDCSSRNFRKMPNQLIEFADENEGEYIVQLNSLVDTETSGYYWRKSRVELNLRNNSLTDMPTVNGSIYEHVEVLVLSFNNISRLSFNVLPPRLKILRLDHNDLRTLNATTVEAMMSATYLREVDFEENPWNCRPDTRNSLALLEGKFGRNLRYSFDMQTCLDSRQSTSSGENDRLFISFACF